MLLTNKIKNTVLIISLMLNLVLGYLAFHKGEPEIIKTRIRMEIPVPGKINTFPPAVLPKPKTAKPRPDIIKDYIASTDKKKDSLYADAVTERSYEIQYKDNIQEVNVKTNVQGKLLNQVVDYNIYPSKVRIDTVIDIRTPRVNKVFGMLEIGQDMNNISNISPIGKAGIIIKNKKDNLISVSIDTRVNLFLGIGFKL